MNTQGHRKVTLPITILNPYLEVLSQAQQPQPVPAHSPRPQLKQQPQPVPDHAYAIPTRYQRKYATPIEIWEVQLLARL